MRAIDFLPICMVSVFIFLSIFPNPHRFYTNILFFPGFPELFPAFSDPACQAILRSSADPLYWNALAVCQYESIGKFGKYNKISAICSFYSSIGQVFFS